MKRITAALERRSVCHRSAVVLRRRRHAKLIGALACVGALSASAVAQAAPTQFTLVDDTYTHDDWYQFWRFSSQPANWTTPVDYSEGVTYFRYEIESLPERVMLQFCYFQDEHVSEKHACAPAWFFDGPGVYYRKQRNASLWQEKVIDWERELLDFMLIDNLTEGEAAPRLRIEIIAVGAGAQLDAPAHWTCPKDWGCLGDGPVEPPATGGAPGTGGATNTGGEPMTGGTSAGGNTGTGGTEPAAGGSLSTGGTDGSGGMSSGSGGLGSGGTSGSGGDTATGGTTSSRTDDHGDGGRASASSGGHSGSSASGGTAGADTNAGAGGTDEPDGPDESTGGVGIRTNEKVDSATSLGTRSEGCQVSPGHRAAPAANSFGWWCLALVGVRLARHRRRLSSTAEGR